MARSWRPAPRVKWYHIDTPTLWDPAALILFLAAQSYLPEVGILVRAPRRLSPAKTKPVISFLIGARSPAWLAQYTRSRVTPSPFRPPPEGIWAS